MMKKLLKIFIPAAAVVSIIAYLYFAVNQTSYARNNSLMQSLLPGPMVFPKMIQSKGKYYLIRQSNCESFRKQFGVPELAMEADSQVVIFEFFPANASLRKLTSVWFSRTFFGACISNNKIYIAGGYDSEWNPTNTFYEFDLITKKWTTKKPMSKVRANIALEFVNGKIYAVGGNDTRGSVESFKPEQDKWETNNIKYIPSNIKPLEQIVSSAVIDNKIVLMGGGSAFQIFNPGEGILTEGPAIPSKFEYFSCTANNKKLYVACGSLKDGFDDNIYLFNSFDGTWTNAGKTPISRYGCGMTSYNNMLFFLGGSKTDLSKPAQPCDEINVYRPSK
jgi:hypothetical protein